MCDTSCASVQGIKQTIYSYCGDSDCHSGGSRQRHQTDQKISWIPCVTHLVQVQGIKQTIRMYTPLQAMSVGAEKTYWKLRNPIFEQLAPLAYLCILIVFIFATSKMTNQCNSIGEPGSKLLPLGSLWPPSFGGQCSIDFLPVDCGSSDE